MSKANIAFIGMMGTWKSTLSKQLAEICNMTYFDTDNEFEIRYNLTIAEAFDTYGEDYFREKESILVALAAAKVNTVISCGGGVVLQDANMKILAKTCKIVQLKATPEVLYERLHNDKTRPLLKTVTVQKIESIMKERKSLYDKYSDITIDNSKLTVEQALSKLKDLFYKK